MRTFLRARIAATSTASAAEVLELALLLFLFRPKLIGVSQTVKREIDRQTEVKTGINRD